MSTTRKGVSGPSSRGSFMLRSFGPALRWSLPLVWRTCPTHFLAIAASSLASALVPAALSLVVGELVTSLGASEGEPFGRLWLWLWLAMLSMLVAGLAQAIQHYASQRATDELEIGTSRLLLAQAARLDQAFFEDANGQDILSRATRNPGATSLGFLQRFVKIFAELVQIVGLLGVLLYFDPTMSWILVLVALPYMGFQAWVVLMRHEVDRSKTRARRWGNYYRSRLTTPRAVASTRLLGLGSVFRERFESSVVEVLTAMRRTYRLELAGALMVTVVFLATLAVAVGVQAYRVHLGEMVVGDFVAYWIAAWRYRSSLASLVGGVAGQFEAALGVGYLLEFLAVVPTLQSGDRYPDSCRGAIAVEDVTFSYPGSKQPALCGVSLRLQPGEVVAVVGPNGSGKSTLARLLARFYDVDQGTIRLDDHDLRDLDPAFVSRHVAFALQDAVRFEATAEENLAFGDWQRLLGNRDAVTDLAERSGVGELVANLPEGLNTMLGRVFGKYDLSGGQWRHLSTARALARDAAVVILDEPMASLDVHAEQALYQHMSRMVAGRTTLLISHRMASIGLANRVVYMEAGRILEEGTHAELLLLGGAYAALWNRYIDSTASLEKPG